MISYYASLFITTSCLTTCQHHAWTQLHEVCPSSQGQPAGCVEFLHSCNTSQRINIHWPSRRRDAPLVPCADHSARKPFEGVGRQKQFGKSRGHSIPHHTSVKLTTNYSGRTKENQTPMNPRIEIAGHPGLFMTLVAAYIKDLEGSLTNELYKPLVDWPDQIEAVPCGAAASFSLALLDPSLIGFAMCRRPDIETQVYYPAKWPDG